ncbi:MAG TPA: hypothetical protein VMS17_04565, partial [Gemmataceae bacterium]|nr:hypothetical protein [Gemmataceae bacterium]
MRRIVWAGAAVALAAFLPGLTGRLSAADAPLAGVWKISMLSPGREVPYLLVEIKDNNGTPAADVIAFINPQLKDFKVESITADADKSFHATLTGAGATFAVAGYSSKPSEKPEEWLGSMAINGRRSLIRVERTDMKTLPPPGPISPAVQALQKALTTPDPKAKIAALNDLLADKATDPATALNADLALLTALTQTMADAEDVHKAADATVALATPYGPEERRDVLLKAARTLSGYEKTAALAVDYARSAEKLLDATASASEQADVLKALKTALTKKGDAAEAKDVAARLAKIDDQLDAEFLRDAIPFTPTQFTGRTSKSDRVAVVELFTGAQCPPCVAADVAFDAVGKSYKADDLVLLQYHLHIPGP